MKKKIDFRKLDYSSISTILTMGTEDDTEDEIVKFTGYIGKMEEAEFVKNIKDKFTLTSVVTFSDEKGRTIDSLPIQKSRYHALEKRFYSGEPIEVIGLRDAPKIISFYFSDIGLRDAPKIISFYFSDI